LGQGETENPQELRKHASKDNSKVRRQQQLKSQKRPGGKEHGGVDGSSSKSGGKWGGKRGARLLRKAHPLHTIELKKGRTERSIAGEAETKFELWKKELRNVAFRHKGEMPSKGKERESDATEKRDSVLNPFAPGQRQQRWVA